MERKTNKIIDTYKENLPEYLQDYFLRLETRKRLFLEGNTSEICGENLDEILRELDDLYLIAIKYMGGKEFQDSLRR